VVWYWYRSGNGTCTVLAGSVAEPEPPLSGSSSSSRQNCALKVNFLNIIEYLRFSYKVCSFNVVRSLHPPPVFILGVLFLCCPEFTPTSAFHIRCALSMLSSVYTHLRFSYKVCSFYLVRSLHPPPLFISDVLFICFPEFTPTSPFHKRCVCSSVLWIQIRMDP
jgi:hypothetical protein